MISSVRFANTEHLTLNQYPEYKILKITGKGQGAHRFLTFCISHYVKKQPPYWTAALNVGISLSYRIVTNQVFSAPPGLTSVFGMGTGGPPINTNY